MNKNTAADLKDAFLYNLGNALPTIPMVLYTCKPEGHFQAIFVSPTVQEQLGYSPDEWVKNPDFWADRIHPDDAPGVHEGFDTLTDTETCVREYRLQHRDGGYRWVHDERHLVRDAKGAPQSITGCWIDITERNNTADGLGAGKPHFRSLVENLSDSIFVHDGKGRFLDANPAACRNLGYTHDELTALSVTDIEVGIAGNALVDLWRQLRHSGGVRMEGLHRRKDGSRFPVDVSLGLFNDNGDERVIALACDITEAKAVEAALREREARLAQAQAIAHLGHWIWNAEVNTVLWSDEAYHIFGRTKAQLGDSYEGFLSTVYPDDLERVTANVASSIETGNPYECRYRIILPNGTVRHVHALAEMAYDPDSGQLTTMLGTVQDVTNHMETVEALRESETQLRQLTENIRDVFWVDNLEKGRRMIYISPAYEEIWGRTCESLYAEPMSFVDAIHPEDQERVIAAFPRQVTGDYDETYRIIRPDGTLRWIHDRAFPVKNDRGEIYRMAGIASDITELKELQERLIQAQKLEAVGTLAGGVAHDFNNLLAVIMNTAEMARDKTAPEDARHEMLTRIIKTGQRGAGIVKNLLRFARKERIKSEVVAPDALIAEVLTLVEATFDRRIGVERDIVPGLWRIKGDTTQLFQVLMNLCVNARDAVLSRENGCLSVTARNVTDYPGANPGRHILIEVRDNGVGIPENIKEKIIEPFFTTKPPGKGTGLGLSTVYGIVETHGGMLTFDSQEGQGTTFRVLLPASDEEAAKPKAIGGGGVPKAASSRLVLLAEDEPLLQLVLRERLQEMGFDVITAQNGREAANLIARKGAQLGLVILDLMMPEVSGREVLQMLQLNHPATPVIVMSGYGSKDALEELVWPEHYGFLPKPFSIAELSCELERVLA